MILCSLFKDLHVIFSHPGYYLLLSVLSWSEPYSPCFLLLTTDKKVNEQSRGFVGWLKDTRLTLTAKRTALWHAL